MAIQGNIITGSDANGGRFIRSFCECSVGTKVGAEIGQLLGMSVLLLTIILFSQFRTGRDTALVLVATILVYWGPMELVVF